MTWATFDDNFPDHPKVDGLSDGAFRLHVSGICYANRYLTDGVIPATQVHRLVPSYNPSMLDELLKGDLWREREGDYRIRDFLEWNMSRKDTLDRRKRRAEAASKAGKAGARARWTSK